MAYDAGKLGIILGATAAFALVLGLIFYLVLHVAGLLNDRRGRSMRGRGRSSKVSLPPNSYYARAKQEGECCALWLQL